MDDRDFLRAMNITPYKTPAMPGRPSNTFSGDDDDLAHQLVLMLSDEIIRVEARERRFRVATAFVMAGLLAMTGVATWLVAQR